MKESKITKGMKLVCKFSFQYPLIICCSNKCLSLYTCRRVPSMSSSSFEVELLLLSATGGGRHEYKEGPMFHT